MLASCEASRLGVIGGGCAAKGEPNSLLKNRIHSYIELTLGRIHITLRLKRTHILHTCSGERRIACVHLKIVSKAQYHFQRMVNALGQDMRHAMAPDGSERVGC